uniref:Uncharacterized protein n=1 Tax=uncultured Armatimonadetes bacterium TaxID=157466 RepID=A0A6J4I808_9BACT|nr:hypothetical protein AVDCRST_MAG63-1608 [uncultured Armatimonadetes bacterium]
METAVAAHGGVVLPGLRHLLDPLGRQRARRERVNTHELRHRALFYPDRAAFV